MHAQEAYHTRAGMLNRFLFEDSKAVQGPIWVWFSSKGEGHTEFDVPPVPHCRIMDAMMTDKCDFALLKVAATLLEHCEHKLRSLHHLEDILTYLKTEVPGAFPACLTCVQLQFLTHDSCCTHPQQIHPRVCHIDIARVPKFDPCCRLVDARVESMRLIAMRHHQRCGCLSHRHDTILST